VKAAVAQSWVTVSFDLQFQGPFLIHDATLAGLVGYDHAPLLEKLPPANRDDKWRARPVLSGAGLRGVLRSHAERIARTLATHYAWKKETDAEKRKAVFLATCPACNPLQSKEKEPLANCDKLLAKHPVTEKIVLPTHKPAEKEHLCLACWLFGSTRRGSRLAIQDASMLWEKKEERLPYKPQDFLAIDRFTGGGLEGAKFDALGLYAPRFRVTMHFENPAPWELGWLTLVLRDFRDELVTFGFGAAKGYGLAKAESFEVKLGFITADDIPLAQKKDETPQALQARKDALAATVTQDRESLYAVLRFEEPSFAANKLLLEDWVAVFNKQVENFHRNPEKLPSPVSDTYLNGKLPELYPLDALATIVAGQSPPAIETAD
jgi:CRISPR/Cas system CSM-associated protein Csm3 (group 7 of RAMP superfamily)